MKITAVYVRVSTTMQNVENQMPDLRRWAQAHGVDAPPDDKWLEKLETWRGGNAIWFADEFSGMSYKRPGYQRMMQEFEAGRLERIVAWRLDRIGRRATGLSKLFDDCQQRGVNVVTLRDGVDLSTPAGRLIAGVLASIAQFECESMKERQGAKLKLDRDRQRQAHELRQGGADVDAIARKLLLPAEVVEKMLSKPVGTMWFGGRRPGSGRIKTCSSERVDELLRAGLKVAEVAGACGASKRTVQRRLKELRRCEVD